MLRFFFCSLVLLAVMSASTAYAFPALDSFFNTTQPGTVTTLPGTNIQLCYSRCGVTHCRGLVDEATNGNYYWATCSDQAVSPSASPSGNAASAAAQAAGAAAGGLYFGGRIVEVIPCDVGSLITIVGVPYSGLLRWVPPGGAPPYLINMSAPPVMTQCITGAMGPLLVCTWGGNTVGAGPVILRYGSGLPGCVTGMSTPAGTPGGGANPLASLGQQLQSTLQNLGMSSVSNLLQGGQGGQGSQSGENGRSTSSSGTHGGTTPNAPACRSAVGGSAADVRRATTAVLEDLAGSCVSVSATSCLDVIRGGRTTFGTQCTTVGSKSCSVLSYIETMCGRCSGAAVTIIGRESALAPGSTRAVDVAFDEKLNQCVLAYTSIGKTLRGYDAYRDSVTRATWVRVVRDSDQYWHVCAPGTVCN